ncbi:MFS general substrate transporter [Cylindrobasidium torrendii FP15055 ss-10]|uniref:MFS general substrate transporter n=1 Tax=Cylindrobasidium torrendii FP15055 ss-10 TaxID=1314674 RepID=A0A0D7BPB3_9AGAR|nr:MFS general substrate transporter [Cylindrobasidium torrendii FP15055 ss-10]
MVRTPSAVFLQDEQDRKITRRILWKLDIHILPAIALLWLANFIDRSNIGNARIAGLEDDLHLKGNQFNIILAVFYLTYLVVEMPSNWVLKKMKPDRWIPLLVFVWGIVTTLTCLVQNFAGLVAVRLALGLCEGGLLAGIVLYLSTIYKRHELQFRVGVFYASASLSGAFGGLLATAIIRMDGIAGLAGWRWIFLLEGIATCLLAFLAWMSMPSNIAEAKFLTPEEREFALNRFRMDYGQQSTTLTPVEDTEKAGISKIEGATVVAKPVEYEEERFEWREVIRGCVDPQLWLTGIAYFGILVSLYSYSLFLPTIVSGLGYEAAEAQLHTVPPYVPAAVMTVVVAILSDRFKWRGPFILMFLPISIAGYILAIAATTDNARYAAVFLMATGVYPSVPCILSILPNNNSGHYKKATTTALQIAIANCSGFVATFAYSSDQKPKYIKGHAISLAFVCLAWVLILLNVLYCRWENKARAEGRRQSNIDTYQRLWDEGKTRAPIGERHPAFIFTL